MAARVQLRLMENQLPSRVSTVEWETRTTLGATLTSKALRNFLSLTLFVRVSSLVKQPRRILRNSRLQVPPSSLPLSQLPVQSAHRRDCRFRASVWLEIFELTFGL